MEFKFIHAADIHLDSPLLGLEQYDGAPVEEIRSASRRAFENLVKLAIDEQVAFVLIAGDLYDGDLRDYSAVLFLAAQVSRLRQQGIDVFVAKGNHDAESVVTRELKLPDNAYVFGSKEPETRLVEKLKVAIHGQSFREREVSGDMSAAYPKPKAGYLNIGLLHTSADGREGHASYSPCSPQQLAAKGYDYWALGHVHKREVVLSEPYVVFTGNIQGRHVLETEYDRLGQRTGGKGCTLVAVRDGAVERVDHRVLDVVRWCRCVVNANEAETPEDVVRLCRAEIIRELEHTDDQLLAVRIRVEGVCKAHPDLAGDAERWLNEIRSSATDASAGRVWVESVELQTAPGIDLDVLRTQQSAIGDLLRFIEGIPADGTRLDRLTAALQPLRSKIAGLPMNAADSVSDIALDDGSYVEALLGDVQHLLVSRLLKMGGQQ